MTTRFCILLSLLASTAAAHAADPVPAPPSPPAMSAAECEVWERERSFARSVAEHDADAFLAHLDPGAVFIAGSGATTRGATTVAVEWAPLIAGQDVALRWHPRHVVIGADPDIAHSRGPYWIENRDPDAPDRFVTGQFVSIWTRAGGEWRVLFDGGGGGRAEPASAEQIDALKASLAPACPSAG